MFLCACKTFLGIIPIFLKNPANALRRGLFQAKGILGYTFIKHATFSLAGDQPRAEKGLRNPSLVAWIRNLKHEYG
jgi:hypothetical protein